MHSYCCLPCSLSSSLPSLLAFCSRPDRIQTFYLDGQVSADLPTLLAARHNLQLLPLLSHPSACPPPGDLTPPFIGIQPSPSQFGKFTPHPRHPSWSGLTWLTRQLQALPQGPQGTWKGPLRPYFPHGNHLFLCLSFLLDDKLLKPRTVPGCSQLLAQCLVYSKSSTLVVEARMSGGGLASTCGMPASIWVLRGGEDRAYGGTLVVVTSSGENL